MFIKIDKFMLFCIKVKPMHKETESFSPMILLLLFPYSFYIPDTTLTNNSTSTIRIIGLITFTPLFTTIPAPT